MKKHKSSCSAGIPATAGKKSPVDTWLINLSRQVSAACDRFWLQTAERRLIQRHRTRGLFDLSDKSWTSTLPPSPATKPT